MSLVWLWECGAARLGSARLGAGRKETLPSQSFSLETLPGPHQRSPSFSATFLPPRLLPQCAVFPARHSLPLQDMLNKHGSKTALPTPSLHPPRFAAPQKENHSDFLQLWSSLFHLCQQRWGLSVMEVFAAWNKIEGSPCSCCSTGGKEPWQSNTTATHKLYSSSEGIVNPTCLHAYNILWQKNKRLFW